MTSWEDLDRARQNLEKLYEKNKLAMYHTQRMEMERDIRNMREVTKAARDSYVRWLWTGR